MKKIFFLALLPLMFAACGGSQGGENASLEGKKAQLAQYKSEMDALRGKIQALEAEIAEMEVASGQAAPARVVTVADVRTEVFSHFIDLQGTIEAENSMMVTAGMPGLIKKVYVKEGQNVTAGQLLAEVESGALDESIKQLEINLELAKTAYERQKSLFDQKIGTEIQYLQAKTAFESLQQQLVVLREQQKLTKITAPVGGTLDELYAKVGSAAAPGVPIATLVNTGDLRAKARVPDAYAGNVRRDAPVKVILPDLGDTIQSRVGFIGNAVNAYTRTFTVECSVPQRPNVKANMFARISINDQNIPNAVVLPENLVQSDYDGRRFVLVAVEEGGKKVARKRFVELGASYNGRVHITKGLGTGDRFISFGFQTVADGQEISF